VYKPWPASNNVSVASSEPRPARDRWSQRRRQDDRDVKLRSERWSDNVEYLNPDDIARDRFGDWNSPEASLKAARWTTQRREELLAQRAGIAFETVFSTEEKLDFIARAWEAHYFIRVFFVGTSDPRINAARVADRVMQGGHTVPIEKIVSRYAKLLANLMPAIRLGVRSSQAAGQTQQRVHDNPEEE
jgi:predicted ABC-type ATPase